MVKKLFTKKKDFVKKVSMPFFDDEARLISGEEKIEILVDRVNKNKGKIINISYSNNRYIYTD